MVEGDIYYRSGTASAEELTQRQDGCIIAQFPLRNVCFDRLEPPRVKGAAKSLLSTYELESRDQIKLPR